MSTTNATTARTITAKSGMLLPATITQQTDMNLLLTALTVYYKQAGCTASWDTAIAVMEAMRDSNAVIVLYVALDGEQTARCLWPVAITLTKENRIAVRAYCTMRRVYRTFRLDRMLTCHPLSTPDDIETAA